MNVSVIVPRAGTCPHRQRAWDWVRAQYDGLEVVEGWGDPARWSKAEAVDDALQRATGELLVVADADVWSDGLDVIIERVRAGAPWGSPHTHVRRLTEEGTRRFIAGERESAPYEEIHFATVGGGLVVVPRATYEQVPLDPRFVGWGGEDKAWALALSRMVGRPARGDGVLWHLWHPPQQRLSRTVGSEANPALRTRYFDAWSKQLMRTLVEEARECRSPISSPCP